MRFVWKSGGMGQSNAPASPAGIVGCLRGCPTICAVLAVWICLLCDISSPERTHTRHIARFPLSKMGTLLCVTRPLLTPPPPPPHRCNLLLLHPTNGERHIALAASLHGSPAGPGRQCTCVVPAVAADAAAGVATLLQVARTRQLRCPF